MINLKRRFHDASSAGHFYPGASFILTLRRAVLKQAGISHWTVSKKKIAALAVCGFADHYQDGEKLMPRKHIAEQAQFPECAKFALRDAMTLEKWPVSRASMPCISRAFGLRHRPDTRMHHRLRLWMRQQENPLAG
jgi:hypothetical protein